MEQTFLVLASVSGALAVALGAFGAHGLRKRLAGLPDGEQRAGWWATAAHYHLAHALALGLAAGVAGRAPGSAATAAGFCLVAGTVIFSGSLYAMALTGARKLGAITPLGGASLIAGWAALAAAAMGLQG